MTDGGAVFGADVFPSLDAGKREERLAAVGAVEDRTEFNAYLVRHADGALDLVDTGCGTVFGEAGGGLVARLAELGVQPGDINRVIFTHLHGDHAGGATDSRGLVFTNADVWLQADEAAFWQGKDAPGGRLLAAATGRLHLVSGDAQIGGGICALPLPGHTPGHMGLRIGGGLVLTGDILHSEALQLPAPDTESRYDSDPVTATASRRAALAEIARRGLIWSGSHLLGPAKFRRLWEQCGGYIAPAA